jgi:RNA polymerase sigma factor (sigma-70 family)
MSGAVDKRRSAFVGIRANRVVLRELRTLFNLGAIGELTDGQLLERFATSGGESAELAFAALVERHGPMVLRVCRSALRDRHDADDAFQATFLVLVQKARALWVKDSLGPWLHRVAHRVATRARHSEARRRDHERRAAAMSPMLAPEPDSRDELMALVHDEIDRLPERYRVPIVICDLQGFTHEKAARHLGWPLGTVKSRLARAREILRGRLSRRGLGLHAGLLIAGKGPAAALRAVEAVLPPSLAESTVAAATALASGRAAGAISAGVTILIRQGLKTMFLNKLKLASIALLFFGAAAATTVGVLAQSGARFKPMPAGPTNSPASFALHGGRMSAPPPAPESAPALITQSRATIVSVLEEELASARMQRDRALNRIGGHTDPAAIEAQKTVDALDQLVARIDEVLVDAVKAYPKMFDVSEGPAPVSSQNQSEDQQGKSGNSNSKPEQAGGKSGAQEPKNQGQPREESNRSEQAVPQRDNQKGEDSQDRPGEKAGQPSQSGDLQSPNGQKGQPGENQAQLNVVRSLGSRPKPSREP